MGLEIVVLLCQYFFVILYCSTSLLEIWLRRSGMYLLFHHIVIWPPTYCLSLKPLSSTIVPSSLFPCLHHGLDQPNLPIGLRDASVWKLASVSSAVSAVESSYKKHLLHLVSNMALWKIHARIVLFTLLRQGVRVCTAVCLDTVRVTEIWLRTE